MSTRAELASSSARGKFAREVLRASAILLALMLLLQVVSAQQQRAPQVSSELSEQNMSLVAASAADIKVVLVSNAGLMVELKRWVAKEATDHGQIISESDLTNDAIFDRLDNDVRFRSVATSLLEKYGYLVPQVNPDSPMGKEQELLIQERVKWVSQEEAENREAERSERQQEVKDMQKARACAEGTQTTDCPHPQPSIPMQTVVQPGAGGAIQQGLPTDISPGMPVFPSSPSQPGTFGSPNGSDSLQQALLVGSGAESENGLDGLGSTLGGSGGNSPFGSLANTSLGLGSRGSNSNSFALLQGAGGDDVNQSGNSPLASTQGMSSLGGGFGGFGSAMGGMGFLGGGDFGEDMYSEDMTPRGGLETMSPAYTAGTPVIPQLSYGRGSELRATAQPAMARVPNPYRDIPSLYDMYLQASPRPATPQRFGMEVFVNGTRDPQLIPMDLPAGPDYVVGPGDGLSIDLWGSVSRRVVRTVDREGRVSLPEVGPILVSGMSLADVQRNVQQELRTQFRDESADVSLSRLRTIRLYEVGDVTNPGAYDISSLSTPLNALFAAGGPTPQGSLRIVKHYRGNQLIQVVDMYDLLLHGVRGNVQRLDDGDTIVVPPAGPQVTIEGMVRRPAVYELKDEKDLASVVDLAGGLLPTAALGHIEVQRLVAHEKQTMLSLDIPDGASSADVEKKLKSFEIQDGDRIRIFPIAQGNEDAVYLEGHVIRPGRYAYRPNMRVTDVIGSFKDLLPQPALQYAEIIRLNAPDFHPTVESFDLSDALENPSQGPTLHPMDTIRIFSRFDFEPPPTVSVLGDVRAPGTYQTSGQIHLSDAIHLAGGLAPDAQTGDAQVFRYLPDGKAKILSVNLSGALGGDPAENIVLDPRDRVLIHRSPDAQQPAVVYIEGEVEKPGRYPLTTNMTIAELIKAGGGLQPSADKQSADLTHYDWATGDRLSGKHESIELTDALSGGSKSDVSLSNGDVVTIRQLPGWSDLGASITVKGEVKDPGTYGIRPGERLSSILERAGGFEPSAYPYGAILERTEVRQIEAKQRDEMILRIKGVENTLEAMPDTDPRQKQTKEATLGQYQTTLTELSSNPPTGRVTIRISSNIKRWKNTNADIGVQAGDILIIPKRPDFVMVTGQVFNPTAVSYRPGKNAKWYLSQSGGPTTQANKKDIFVIRADGSVISAKQGLWDGDSLGSALEPGDTVVVPEKAIGGGPNWTNLFAAGQVASSIATAAVFAAHY